MAHIIYEDKKYPWSYVKLNPTNQFVKHLSNYYYLRWITEKSDNFIEKQQANKEMTIAEKKMKYWERSPEFNSNEAKRMHQKLKNEWGLGTLIR